MDRSIDRSWDPLDDGGILHNSRFVLAGNKATAGRECNWFARNDGSRGEGDSAPGEFSLSPLGKRVESFFVRARACRLRRRRCRGAAVGMQMDDFVRESRVSPSCTRPSENNKSRLTTPPRSLRFVPFALFFPSSSLLPSSFLSFSTRFDLDKSWSTSPRR